MSASSAVSPAAITASRRSSEQAFGHRRCRSPEARFPSSSRYRYSILRHILHIYKPRQHIIGLVRLAVDLEAARAAPERLLHAEIVLDHAAARACPGNRCVGVELDHLRTIPRALITDLPQQL